ncbi:MAG TPA: DUF3368 domain-containing protein [Leucothrix mucor]|nr:DUF3368 domain-containing protein [Leucothrix mucor]
MNIIVSDSSSLIALLNINQLELLKLSFNKVMVPPMVAQEVEHGEFSDSAWFSLKESGFICIERLINEDNRLILLNLQLDAGESEAILLADQLKLSLLIDERAGRNMATSMGLHIIGLVGVLYALKQKNQIDTKTMKQLVSALEKAHFRMSNALKKLLLS